MHLRLFAFSLFAAIGLAACGGGGSNGFVAIPSPTNVPTTAPTATPAAPAAVATSVPFNGGAAQVEAPIAATPLPAPTGYTQTISASLVTVPANTTVQVHAGASPPATIPVLDKARRTTTVRRFVSSPYNPIYYDVIIPSNSVTVAGTVTNTQTFPVGVLTAGTQYYLGFYDTTQGAPAWQTIAGPVTSTDGKTLTFTGNVPSFTFQANAAYAFVIFSTSSASTTPPPSQSQDVAYLPQGANGIEIVNAAGAVQKTLPINSNELALDDAGNIYNLYATPPPSPSPGASSTPTPGPATVQMYPAGSSTASLTYQFPASNAALYASGAGLFAGVYSTANAGTYGFTANAAVWTPGAQGAPSYTLSLTQNGSQSFDMQHDGTIIMGQFNGTSYSYNVYPPGSTTPSRTIPESIVPTSQQFAFAPNYMTVGPDGTLYVTEFSYNTPDALAGLYIYPPSGPEKFVATASDATNGSGPQGIDIDATGNIYVANNNAGYIQSTCGPTGCTPNTNTLQNIQVFAPGGTSVLRTIPTTGMDAYPVVVAADGTVFFSSFPGVQNSTATPGVFAVAPGGTTLTTLSTNGATSISLYNGYAETQALRHRNSASSAAAGLAHNNPAAFRALILARARQHIR